ncbi:MAG: peptidyl-prolyl cis-trans isomerase [Gemmatimonadota bacterium]
MRRPTVPSCLRVAVAAAALLVSCSREPAPPADSDVVVAEVNGSPITLKELKGEIAELRGLATAGETRTATATEITRAMRILVERAVVLREGERLKIAVSASELDDEVRRFRADFPPGGLEKSLLQAGIEMADWRAALARSILFRKSAAAIAASRAAVTDEEVRKTFNARRRDMARPERIRVRQFLFDSEETAREARSLIEKGTETDEVVRRLAAGDSAPAAADLGSLALDDLPPDLGPALFALPEGGVSGVVRREGSYSLFQVLAKEPARTLDFAAAAPEIREELLAARREEAFRRWVAEEAGQADVRIREAILAQLKGGSG